MTDLQHPGIRLHLHLFRNAAFSEIAGQDPVKDRLTSVQNNFPVCGIQILQKLQLLFLIKAHIQLNDRVHGKLPHLPVVIRLFLQITVNQLQADDRYHIRSGTLHLHFTGKRNAFLHPLDHTALPALIEGKYHQGSLQMDLTVQRLCLAPGKLHFRPQHPFNDRFAAWKRDVLL